MVKRKKGKKAKSKGKKGKKKPKKKKKGKKKKRKRKKTTFEEDLRAFFELSDKEIEALKLEEIEEEFQCPQCGRFLVWESKQCRCGVDFVEEDLKHEAEITDFFEKLVKPEEEIEPEAEEKEEEKVEEKEEELEEEVERPEEKVEREIVEEEEKPEEEEKVEEEKKAPPPLEPEKIEPPEMYHCPVCGNFVETEGALCAACHVHLEADLPEVLKPDELEEAVEIVEEPVELDEAERARIEKKGITTERVSRDRKLFYTGAVLIFLGGPIIALSSWLHDWFRVPMIGYAYDAFGWINVYFAVVGFIMLFVGLAFFIISLRGGTIKDKSYEYLKTEGRGVR